MKLVDIPRGMGKTFNLVILSLKNNIPIIVSSVGSHKKYIYYDLLKREFPNENPDNLKVYTYQEYLELESKPEKVYLDDCFNILQFDIFENSSIDIATYSSEDCLFQDNTLFLSK